ncbi:hypothetical protein A3H10_03845 [Candidatus Uhrbacteria bacterium RIFCSPLOWO2_12_FULL_46_10]|uniref:Uncharacterized protein n=1 Tax=Candidatus Uhrbacteria bacterium RIFCSPLOWO2_01_FULL_47_25 TaxID=1802402 RepID=A0A1F7URS2_9BACT|nr:MAG: hypothetical protein A2752_02220 [Candidatus Uhrbacteria bacterium RIFCSPHIGHO2_01_FULL_46_23]OGL68141.1 MAG: hypothetical protein A3D60_04015 [Candidatus Uhrbacteria bacterium RIFCSPHIGHO2_02_FULL_47_29]OGL74814.1 MAG: hypothetical protein A3E96_04670 [Candidatus Uhrbacteria bacterium RIFCSPHIGHO2_12_FULL_46_13]OGL80992.1 MAG: hypothetical protein A2936_03350 [Candidatus Uhrbacteria bacterium RIFCSPLOWO2_01_FULL_47_25]OGL84687.1 MAG: hypothetical protein A3I37_04960 [Candidatus Uhrbact
MKNFKILSSLNLNRRSQLELFIVFLVIFFVFIGAMVFTAKRLGHDNGNNRATGIQRETVYQQDIKRNYEKEIVPIVRSFAAEGSAGTTEERLTAIVKTRDALLSLTVPKEYTDLHLQLVIALSQLEGGYKGDADKLASGQKNLREIYDSNPWLR